MNQTSQELTGLLAAWRDGDPDALSRIVPLVYDELRHLAHRYVRQQPHEHTLQTTALVHEAYLRLAGRDEVNWQNRAHFFAVCAQVMRSLLIDRARARQANKRGGGAEQVELDETSVAEKSQDEELLVLNAALEKLAKVDLRKSRIVEMRYFGGMSAQEIATTLGTSAVTVKREWLKARAWLYREIAPDNTAIPGKASSSSSGS
ncbi:MAG TPA: sigma-70 family RNA polymerase sigma factor [Blastocatellia bacterium]|nr:sigma-70 family RNA polymerase sigma factor [Blastocatellia bacterium]